MQLSHITPEGIPQMVDISNKPNLVRKAKATGYIKLQENTIQLISENKIKKGNVLIVAQIAGIQAAKRTDELIPLCHQINTTGINVELIPDSTGIQVNSEVKCIGATGVEMEALTAVSVSLLTIYDMCKAVDKNMEICNIHLLEKTKEESKK